MQSSRSLTTSPTSSDRVPFKSWVALMGAILRAFMAVLDIQITNASLQEIQAALGATLEEGSWISTSYLVAEIVVIPPQYFTSRGADLSTAQDQAIASIDNIVRREAFVMAFNDCFYFIAWTLLLSGIAILFFKKVKATAGAGAH